MRCKKMFEELCRLVPDYWSLMVLPAGKPRGRRCRHPWVGPAWVLAVKYVDRVAERTRNSYPASQGH